MDLLSPFFIKAAVLELTVPAEGCGVLPWSFNAWYRSSMSFGISGTGVVVRDRVFRLAIKRCLLRTVGMGSGMSSASVPVSPSVSVAISITSSSSELWSTLISLLLLDDDLCWRCTLALSGTRNSSGGRYPGGCNPAWSATLSVGGGPLRIEKGLVFGGTDFAGGGG